jgi:hypothetical protein
MKLLSVIAGLVLFGSSAQAQKNLPVYDNEFECISKADADRYTRDYNIDIDSFGGMELCDARVDTKKLFNDLVLVEQGRFNSTGQNIFIKDFVQANNYYSWLKDQTRSIRRADDIPAATAYNSFGNFTMQDGWATLSTLGRVGTIIHEARHTEGYIHIRCTHGPYEGSSNSGCDKDYNYGGSHAVEMEYYGRVVAQGANFHPVYKSMARLMALGRSNFVFNTSPISVREVLTLVDKNGEVSVLDGERLVTRSRPAAQGGVLKRASHGASLFYGAQTLALDMYGSVGAGVNTKDDYSYFKLVNLDRGQGKDPMFDLEELDVGTRRFFVGLKRDGSISSYDFQNGKWNTFVQTGTTGATFVSTLVSGERGVFLRKSDGTLLPFDPLRRTLKPALSEKWPKEVASAAVVNGKILALNASGVVHIKTERGFEVLSSLQGKSVEQFVSSPVYNAFAVAR